MTTLPDRADVRRLAGWLPQDHDGLERWLPHNPNAPQVLVRSVLANATSGDTSTRTAAALGRSG